MIHTQKGTANPGLGGIYAAPCTPFNKKRDVDFDKISCSVDYLKKSRFNGLFVNGTLGEGLSLSLEERKQSLEEWMRHAEGLQLVAHIGTGNLKETQELARHAERIGVDAIAALPPTYYKPANEEQLVEYVIEVTNAAPNTPFLYYEYDVTTGLHHVPSGALPGTR
ncbi:N-acetylneuraminate lyase-like [Dreissena polymorpha]|uniref:N-acetylneuraminate lyase-like n=1 Tax=Dreissena polymorpha TaxID=45954 RepID=UPI002265367B|nr:N-acetylneuraminate lyase-like [Dreissena polymorpha]